MRTAKLGRWLAVGLLGTAMAASAVADPGSAPPPKPGSTSVFNQMFGRNPPPSATVTNTDAAKSKPAPKPAGDPIVKARDQELANWLRRTDVCLKLMEVADQTGDEALRKKAQELDRRARATYERRMAELGGETGKEDDFDRRNSDRPDSTRSAGVLRGNPKPEGGSE